MSLVILLKEAKTKHPELRYGQILAIAASKAGYCNDDLFYIEDSDLEKGLIKVLETWKD